MSTENRQFPQLLRWPKILILEILNVLLQLKFSTALYLKKFSSFRLDIDTNMIGGIK